METVIRSSYEAANRRDIARMDALHSEDVILDLPQSGERIRARAKITELRTSYPAKVHFQDPSNRFGRRVGLGRHNQLQRWPAAESSGGS
jgi:hypothetical protein